MTPVSRRNFMLGSAALAALGQRVARAGQGGSRPEFLVVCIAEGGWDPLMSFDPKSPDLAVDGPWVDFAASEYTRTYNDNQFVQLNDEHRLSVTNFFELWGDRTAVVNGLWQGSIVHEPCRIRLLTGTTQAKHPDFATRFGAWAGADNPIGSIDFSGLSYAGALSATTGRVGSRSQLKALLDPDAAYGPPAGESGRRPLYQPSTADHDRVRGVIEQRAAALRSLRGEGGANDQRLDDLMTSIERQARLRDNAQSFVGGLDLASIPALEDQVPLATNLLHKDLCRAVTLKHELDWDTHTGNMRQHANYSSFFRAVNTLLDDLHSKGLLDRTLVCVLSEMGRTPRLNAAGGKDHWTHSSQLLIGAGVKGGHTYGATDALVESMKMDLASGDPTGSAQDSRAAGELLKYDNFAAGILQHLGLDPGEVYPTVTPFTGWSEYA